MKIKSFILFLLCSGIFLSCISDDGPLNREADIEAFVFKSESFIASNIKNNQVTVLVKQGTDLSNIAPDITITSGASVEPASGVPQDFYETVNYTVTSEDKNWTRKYSITVEYVIPKDTIHYDFEDWHMEGNPPRDYPALTDTWWSSANNGVAIATSNIPRYPTESTTDAYKGNYAASLQTQRGLKVFGLFLTPVFSGSLYRGEFELQGGNFLKSVRFGQIHAKESGKPVLFKGYYKYKPGDVYYYYDQDKKTETILPGEVDECSIYSVLYKVTKGEVGAKEYLDGTNVQTSDKIVAKAIWPDGKEKKEYTEFSVPFVYSEEPDYDNYDYKLAIVFASSIKGDFYCGAVGSTLIVDEVSVICEQYE